MKKPLLRIASVIFLVLIQMLPLLHTHAQEPIFRLNVHKTFGFNSGAQIRGRFSLSVIGDGEIVAVTYLLDGQSIGIVDSPPFDLSVNTTDYPVGRHAFRALVETKDGRMTETETREFEFVTAEGEAAAIQRIIIPLFLGIFLLIAIIAGVQILIYGKKPHSGRGTARRYGWKGGAICPHCHRPYALHWWSLNLVNQHYDRCEYCGMWGLVKAAGQEELENAESAWDALNESQALPNPKKTDDLLRERIEDTRYFRE